jgi:hypothetical protein
MEDTGWIRKGVFLLGQDDVCMIIMTRERVMDRNINITGNSEKPAFPQKDTLPTVKRAKQAAGITLPAILLPIKSG